MSTAKAVFKSSPATIYHNRVQREEEHEFFVLAGKSIFTLLIVAIIVPVILYLGLHFSELGQYRCLEYIIPGIFIAACGLVFYFCFWRELKVKNRQKT